MGESYIFPLYFTLLMKAPVTSVKHGCIKLIIDRLLFLFNSLHTIKFISLILYCNFKLH